MDRVKGRNRPRALAAAGALIAGFACSAGGEKDGTTGSGAPRLPGTSVGAGDLLGGQGGTSASAPGLSPDGDALQPTGASATDDAHTQPARRVDCADMNQLAAFRAAAPRSEHPAGRRAMDQSGACATP